VRPLRDKVECSVVQLSHPLYLLEGAANLDGRSDIAEVQEGPANRRNSDAVSLLNFVEMKPADAVELNAALSRPRLARGCHVDARALTVADAEEGRTLAMAEHRAIATCQHGSQPAASSYEAAVPNGVDTTVQPNQPS
jgi:hypothetical protein